MPKLKLFFSSKKVSIWKDLMLLIHQPCFKGFTMTFLRGLKAITVQFIILLYHNTHTTAIILYKHSFCPKVSLKAFEKKNKHSILLSSHLKSKQSTYSFLKEKVWLSLVCARRARKRLLVIMIFQALIGFDPHAHAFFLDGYYINKHVNTLEHWV